MLSVKFIYTENGKQKSSLDEHKRRCEIMEHNKKLCRDYPLFKDKKRNDKI